MLINLQNFKEKYPLDKQKTRPLILFWIKKRNLWVENIELTIFRNLKGSRISQNFSHSLQGVFWNIFGLNVPQIKMTSHPRKWTNQSQTNHCIHSQGQKGQEKLGDGQYGGGPSKRGIEIQWLEVNVVVQNQYN